VRNESKEFTLIDKDFTAEGTISTKGEMIIKGTLKGNLTGKKVVIAREGTARANIDVASITIGGIFEGELNASEELIIRSTGKCSGKIVCKTLVVESGGVLNAEISCKP
jgi:cytoskeletal protein CcmA (bactofilin family)